MADEALNSTSLHPLPQTCKSTLIKLVCSTVYPKCVDDVVLTDPLTYSSAGLPYLPPCNDLCTSVDEDCYGLLTMFGVAPNCSDTSIYSSSSDPTICNSMDNSTYVVSGTEEFLIPSNDACSDVAANYATEVFVPPSHAIGLGLSPLRGSYVAQSALNVKMDYVFSAVPNW